jgi:hypothetical protein
LLFNSNENVGDVLYLTTILNIKNMRNACSNYYPDKEPITHGDFVITPKKIQRKQDFIIREFVLELVN